MDILRSIYKFFSSFALATIVLVLLTLITLLGTLDQVYLGLFVSIKTYFHSWFVLSELPSRVGIPIPLPLPGGLLLMILMFINMALGSVVHVRKRLRGLPNLVTHFGMLFLFISAFVTFIGKRDGYIDLFPGQSSNMISSYKTWQLEILEFNEEEKPTKAHVIPWEQLVGIKDGREQEFTSASLPFSLSVDSFIRNARAIHSTHADAYRAGGREVDGYKLLSVPRDKREERNYPGCFVAVKPKDSKEEEKPVLLSGLSSAYMAGVSPKVAGFQVGGKQYGLQLVKTSWQLPYHIKLDKFIFEKHPGTDKPKNYESRITRLETRDAAEGKKVAVRMNEPMRHDGFVVFQESFGPPNPEDGVYYSQFAISDNPSDQWPTIALVIMTIGLTLQFLWKLIEYLNKSQKRSRKA